MIDSLLRSRHAMMYAVSDHWRGGVGLCVCVCVCVCVHYVMIDSLLLRFIFFV
jgi:hypothetical protein